MENLSYWKEQKPGQIVHGLQVDWELVDQYLPPKNNNYVPPKLRELVLELGAGDGLLLNQLVSRRPGQFRSVAIDVNPQVVNSLVASGIDARQGDVKEWGVAFREEGVMQVENYQLVIAQAVTPSLLGSDMHSWKTMMDAVDVFLKPGGFFVFNDFRRADSYYAPLARQVGGEVAQIIMQRWGRRYRENSKAFNKFGLMYGDFVVGKPGTVGKVLELDDAGKLNLIKENPDLFERFARHIDHVEVGRHLGRKLGWELRKEKWQYYRSRGSHGLLAPTVLQVWQKPFVYKYDTLVDGLDVRESDAWLEQVVNKRDRLSREAEEHGRSYFIEKLAMMIFRIPASQREALMLVAEAYKQRMRERAHD